MTGARGPTGHAAPGPGDRRLCARVGLASAAAHPRCRVRVRGGRAVRLSRRFPDRLDKPVEQLLAVVGEIQERCGFLCWTPVLLRSSTRPRAGAPGSGDRCELFRATSAGADAVIRKAGRVTRVHLAENPPPARAHPGRGRQTCRRVAAVAERIRDRQGPRRRRLRVAPARRPRRVGRISRTSPRPRRSDPACRPRPLR